MPLFLRTDGGKCNLLSGKSIYINALGLSKVSGQDLRDLVLLCNGKVTVDSPHLLPYAHAFAHLPDHQQASEGGLHDLFSSGGAAEKLEDARRQGRGGIPFLLHLHALLSSSSLTFICRAVVAR